MLCLKVPLPFCFFWNACICVTAVPLAARRIARSEPQEVGESQSALPIESVTISPADIRSSVATGNDEALPVASGEEVMTYEKETQHIESILRSFGKLKPGYSGKQRLLGFQEGRLFDENGMFAFDDSIQSVALDVGAATNPLVFDLDIDATHMVFMFEALPGTSDGMEKAFEQDNIALQKRGGCDARWDPFCAQDRFLWFKTAVAPKVGYADLVLSDNPYCSSLGDFAIHTNSDVDPILLKDSSMSGVLNTCWNATRSKVQVPSVSLASIIKRIPKRIKVKYLKIDAQGHDFDILLSAGDYMSRIDYVRFEFQVDPPANRKMVEDIPSYAEVVDTMKQRGFVFEGDRACDDSTMSDFSKAIHESECVFCQNPPCLESGKPPLGPNPAEVVMREGSWASLAHGSFQID